MPLSAASILHALLLLLGATASAAASVSAGDGYVNTTAASATATPLDDTEIYICYLCTGRNPLLIRYCPIYWDECHLVCYAYDAPAATAIPAAPVPVPSRGSPTLRGAYGDGCYVMKLYWNGTYVIVARQDCSQVARCLLSCGGGDAIDWKALGAASTGPAAATAAQGVLPRPRVADFQRCGTQLTAPAPNAVPGVVQRRH
ncbi:uncharacterized protein LOC133910956 [Phragmites australis]|uniref:uncharacterized protein LOC133910956 n=1 Tax=Phragmites australis TaxID=29695 RepID=UPI002D797255|nr:uncharacterized protein LOC133910956 [Phragmites australis]